MDRLRTTKRNKWSGGDGVCAAAVASCVLGECGVSSRFGEGVRGERKDWRLERRNLGRGKDSYGIVKV